MKKRIISSILALLILLTLAPTNAFATDEINFNDMTSQEYARWKQAYLASQAVSLMSNDLYDQNYGYIRNDYIEAYVDENGRYTMGTTGGNPNSSTDDHSLLLYGHPGASTSQTLIRIDGVDEYFYAENVTFSADGKQVIATATYDNVLITQIISFETNTYTGNEDVISIKYILKNQGSSAKQIGGRIMLDTMLGDNDGSPFRVSNVGNIVDEKEFSGDHIPQYWQSFDSLTNPRVISTGTFYRTESERPDKVQFANWWNIRGSGWNFRVSAYASVTGDSAVAAYYNPRTVLPGQSRTIATYYGISDFLQSEMDDDINVRVTAPSFLGGTGSAYLNNPFDLSVYVANHMENTINNVTAKLVLPEELEINGSDLSSKTIQSLAAGYESSVKWTVRALPQTATKTVPYKIVVFGDGIETKEIPLTLQLFSVNDRYRTITFDLNGGEGTPPASQEVLIGQKGTEPPRPTRAGYVFKGWYANPQCTGLPWFNAFNIGAISRVLEDITLYAKWQPFELSISDLYSFDNTYSDFNDTYAMSKEYFNILTQGMTKAEKEDMEDRRDSEWGGSCFGMSVTEALMMMGAMDAEFFKDTEDEVNCAADLYAPVDNSKVEGMVNFYHLSQHLDSVQQTKNTGKSQQQLLSELVTQAMNIDNTGELICISMSKYSNVLGLFPKRESGHAVIAYDAEKLSNGNYKVKILESNAHDLISSYMIVSADYKDATFYCSWGSYNGIDVSDGTLKINGLSRPWEYNSIRLQQELMNRGMTVAPYAMRSTEVVPDMIKISYDSAEIETKNGLVATITDGGVEKDEIHLGETFGSDDNSVLYWHPDNHDYYKITSKENDTAEYQTSVLFADEERIEVNTKEPGAMEFEKGSGVTVTTATDNEMAVTITGDTIFFDNCKIVNKTNQMSVTKAADGYTVSSPDGFSGTISIELGDSVSSMNIETEDTQIKLLQKMQNEDLVLQVNDADEAPINVIEPEYNVYFYTHGGSIVEDVTNVAIGQTIQRPEDPTFEGFVFAGWYKTAECLDGEEWDFENDVVEGDTTIHAKWVADEDYLHSVTFKAEGHDDVIILVKDGATLEDLPLVPKKYGFAGQWDVQNFENISSNMTVNAIYGETNAITPIASVDGGTYASAQSVTLTTTTSNGAIYYTLDGSTPTKNSKLYTQPITVATSMTLKAIAVKEGIEDSAVMTEKYTIAWNNPFKDVKKKDWFHDAVQYAYTYRLFSGTSAKTFGPNETMTRGMFVTVLGRLAGVPNNSQVTTAFSDVKKGQYYTAYVKWANENGIVAGLTTTTFGPDSNITREQICAIIIRYCSYADISLQQINPGISFKDSKNISGYARAAVKVCQMGGLIQGEKVGGGYNFRPKGNATRAEVATIIMNFSKIYK